MKNFLLLILLATFIFTSCKKPEIDKPYVPVTRCADMTENMDTINLFIRGNWEWVESYSITRTFQGYVTPNTPGKNHHSLKLHGDTLQFFENIIPDSIYAFRIQRLSDFTNYPDDSLPVITYRSRYTGMGGGIIPIKICKDQLLIHSEGVSSIDVESLWIRK